MGKRERREKRLRRARAREASRATANHRQARWRTPPARIGFSSVVLLVLVVVGWTLGWRRFDSASPATPPPAASGTLLTYFDRPGVAATIRVTPQAFEDTRTELSIYVTVDAPTDVNDITVSVVATGKARGIVSESMPDQANGCPHFVIPLPEEGSSCSTIKTDPNGFGADPSVYVDAELINLTLHRNDLGFMFGSVTIYCDFPLEQRSGDRSYIRLPTFGTTAIPAPRDGTPLKFGTIERRAPASVVTIVDYRSLLPNERSDTVSPDVVQSGRLTWVESAASSISASASIVDVTREADDQRDVFIAGLVVGLTSAFAPGALGALWKAVLDHRRARLERDAHEAA